MANILYPIAKQRLLEWALTDAGPAGDATFHIIGVTSAYVYNAAHEVIADVSGATIVAPETELENVTMALGVLDANDPSITGMTVSETLDAFIVFARWAGDSLLLCYMDTPGDGTIPSVIDSATGLVIFDADGIFRL